uniref:Uncharacterized protein n=1 Tax=Geobacillus sp. (strain WCH70) TaxID=471223 RepID=C5D547_GEOSW
MDTRKKINNLRGIEKTNLIAKLASGLKKHHDFPKNVEEFIQYQLSVTGEVWETNVREKDKLVIVDFILPNLFASIPSTLVVSFFGDQILIYIDAELTIFEKTFLKAVYENGINNTLKHFHFDLDHKNELRASYLFDGSANFKPEDLMRKIINFTDEAEKVFELIKKEANKINY